MCNKVIKKCKLVEYPAKYSTSNSGRASVLIIFVSLLLLVGIFTGIDTAIALFGLLVALVAFTHSLLKLSSIIRPQSKTFVDADPGYKPFVSIHVACKNEPADIVIETVQALTRLNYPNYEVVVIHSNNTDKPTWHKIKKYINSCGKNYKFVHLDKIDGFKAGALNYINSYKMDKGAEVAAIVDCDYIVTSDFLNETVGYFKDPRVGIVQAPQDYYNVNPYNIGLLYEYRSFFELVMHQAQQLSLVTFTGTMGLIRTELLNKGLKWNEWCITEDVEAGTYINSIGYRGVYVDKSLGKGLMPFEYSSLIKQRQRWAYGNMQIIRKDWLNVITNKKISFNQKIAFFAQLATWFHFELILAIVYLVINVIQFLGYSGYYTKFTSSLMIIMIAFCIFINFIYFIFGMRKSASIFNRIKAFLVHYGLLYIMSSSWVVCLMGKKLGFIVTNKEKKLGKIPFSQYSKEFTIIVILIIGLGLSIINSRFILLDMLVVIVLSIIELIGILYLKKAFIESNKLVI